MSFDLATAFAVREREDGLLEKDTFDLSTATPVEQEISRPTKPLGYSPPDNKDRAVVELAYKEAGQKVPIGLQADWMLTSTPAKMITANILGGIITNGAIPFYNAAKGVANASDPSSDIGRMIFDSAYKGLSENQDIDNLGGAAAKAYPDAPWQLTGSMGALAEVLMFMPNVVKGGAELLSKDKQFTIALNNARQSPKWGDLVGQVAKKANQPLEAVDQALYNKLWGLRNESNCFEVLNSNLKKATGIDLTKLPGMSTEFVNPKIGQTVNYTDALGLVKSGIIQDVAKEGRIVIASEGKEIVTTIKNLSLPKPTEMPQIKSETAQGGTITPKTTIARQKPPVEPPKTAVSGAPEEQPKPIIKNLNISEEAKAQVESAAAQITPELEKVKGKPLTHDEVVQAAQQSDILSKVISREESKQFEAKLLRTRQHLAAMAEGKGVTQEFIDTLKTVKAFGTDAARKLGSLRIEAEANEFNIKTKLVNDLLEKNIEIDDIIKASEGIDFNNQEQVTKFYRQFVKPKIFDLINEYRYINLLSSPKTHIVNTFSNLIQVSGLAPGTKLFTGDVKGTTAFYRGAWNSLGEAGVKALDALKGKSFVERPDVAHIPTGSNLLKWGRWIPQALEASDVFFRTIAYEGELTSQLAKGADTKEAEKIAKDKASYYVFRKALDPSNKTGQGKLLSAIDNLTTLAYKARNIPVFGRLISWYIPFVQTPMNIAKQMIEYSPLGFSTIPGAKDKREQLAKALLGSLIFGTAAYLVSKNESTWSVPTNKKEKELFFAAGRQPFSIKIGNTWVGYSRLGPLAFPIAIPAAIKYYTQLNPNSATDNNLQKTSKVIGGLGEFFASMSYVEGIGQLMNLVKNAPGAAAQLVVEGPSQLIPLSSLQRWINNFIIDPIYRKTDKELSAESIIDGARKSLIFGTKGLPAFENPAGEESRRSYPGLNAFSPIPVTKSNQEYEQEYKQYIDERKETLIDKQDRGDEPRRRTRRRR